MEIEINFIMFLVCTGQIRGNMINYFQWDDLFWLGKEYRYWKLGLVLMGWVMFSKSLIQFSVDDSSCVPSLLFGLRPNCQPRPSVKTPGHSQASLTQSLVGTLFLSPGSWCAQSFCCALQESVSLTLWKFCNQIPLSSTVKFPGVSQFLCQITRLEYLLWVLKPGTFLTVWGFLWYNCSVVCGLSAWWLYGGVNGDLLQEGLCHRVCDQVSCT